MITKKHMLIVSLLVCALALIALGAGQKSVERPFKINGDLTVMVNMANGQAEGVDFGQATHTGRYHNTMTLQFYPNSDHVTGSGTLTAANGDQLFWDRNDHYFTFTGGTGRFEGATGWFEIDHPEAIYDYSQMPQFVIAKHPYEGMGEIVY